ncbi:MULTISPECIES: YheT family hydrolase [unclassified Rhizobacter]|uniref:YheT family hydrolase n=1 Tax=unclassified Rhizobacter TaxID=2640088 RepID=UPI0006FBCFA4|nr:MULTISPECIES: alpha/beta fold hydrolase [unclassified Rhizobacter]KQU78163.1 alpha/beta hydrolase [Rhizobacter sp. Root29]KQW15909.1 alpha/beta hydrolase [Rhizobacter sp. Root1238]KRB25024.1 alpha/beta hydrolase [Rhizobacter sp. Root16D2]
MDFSSPRWLGGRGAVGGNLQTIWPALYSKRYHGPAPVYRRERWNTPDGDFIDVDFQVGADVADAAANAPLLVLFHGLEGSSASHYAQAFAHWARERGWRYAVPHFRGCSGEINLAPRAYHSGDFEEIGWVLQVLRARHAGPIVAVGVSLGGNALLRWAEEAGETASAVVRGVCAISSPIDLAAGGQAIGRGFNRHVYTRMFLRTMIPKALRKWEQHPGLFDRERLRAARDLYAFDNVFTAPLHGFRDTDDYWQRGSAKPHLHRIRVPALVLNARNDPFVPAHSLPRQAEVGPFVTLWQPHHGGHVGFPAGAWPGHVMTLPEQVMGWLAPHVATAAAD